MGSYEKDSINMTASLFVDLENVLIDPLSGLTEVAEKEFGGVDKMTLYHPFVSDALWQDARLVGAEIVQPLTKMGKSSTDMVLACDMIEAGLYSSAEWIVLVSGDRDFLPALTLIRRRKPEKMIAVLAGSSPSLSEALREAGAVIDRVMVMDTLQRRPDLIDGLLSMLRNKRPPGDYWTQSLLVRYATDPTNGLMPGSATHVVDALRELRRLGEVEFKREEVPGVGMRRVLKLVKKE